ncbi:thermonuclease family protein, partial [Patescibacteria group bacterium]|nr:thermonuclease family protein [Patescibacteria group bacterium]
MLGAMLAFFKKYLPLFFVLSTLFLLISILNPSGNVYPPSSIPLADTTPSVAELKTYYKVTKVIDGDTVDVLIDGKSERIRLIGLDTPETLDPRKPVQCFGTEATNRSREILTDRQ